MWQNNYLKNKAWILCPICELYWSNICCSWTVDAVIKVSDVELSLILKVTFKSLKDISGGMQATETEPRNCRQLYCAILIEVWTFVNTISRLSMFRIPNYFWSWLPSLCLYLNDRPEYYYIKQSYNENDGLVVNCFKYFIESIFIIFHSVYHSY